jgi:hypothetical protein
MILFRSFRNLMPDLGNGAERAGAAVRLLGAVPGAPPVFT